MAAFEGATRIPSVVAYAILLVLLLGLYRFTSIGLDRVPGALECPREVCGDARPLALRPARGSPRHLLVPVALHGHPLLFLLDTGAASTVVAAAAAEALGLVDATRPILGAVNDRFGVQRVLPVEALVVADRVFGDFEVAVIDMPGIRSGLGPEVAGVLGADVLGLEPCEIDFAGRTLVLGRSASAFARSRAAGEADTTVAIEPIGGGWFVRAQADDREAFFLVDTGSNVTQISDTVAEELGGAEASRGRGVDATGARDATLRTRRLAILAVGALARRDFVVAVGETSLLGADFFAGMRLHVDAPARRLTLRTRTVAAGGRRPGVGPRPHAG